MTPTDNSGNKRISPDEYRALAEAEPVSHGSKRGGTGATTGTCRVCGKHVGHADPAQFHVDDVTGESWCRHLTCRLGAVE